MVQYNANIVHFPYLGLLEDETIPCTLSVDGEKRLHVNPAALSFDEVWNGRSDSALIYLVNDGNENTTVTSVTSNNTVFSASFTNAVTVEAFDSVALKVRCFPKKVGTVNGVIKITSNAEDNPVNNLNVSVKLSNHQRLLLTHPQSPQHFFQTTHYAVSLTNSGGRILLLKHLFIIDETGNNNSWPLFHFKRCLIELTLNFLQLFFPQLRK